MPFKDKERQMQGNTNSPSVEIKTLVSNYFRDANVSPSSSPNQKGSLATSPIKSNSSPPDRQEKELQTSRLACVRESLRLNKVVLKGCPKLSLHHGGQVQKSITSLPGVNSIAGVKNDQLIRFLVL